MGVRRGVPASTQESAQVLCRRPWALTRPGFDQSSDLAIAITGAAGPSRGAGVAGTASYSFLGKISLSQDE